LIYIFFFSLRARVIKYSSFGTVPMSAPRVVHAIMAGNMDPPSPSSSYRSRALIDDDNLVILASPHRRRRRGVAPLVSCLVIISFYSLSLQQHGLPQETAVVTSLAHKHYRWIESNEAIVPLVEPFIGPRNRFTRELIYYQPTHNSSSSMESYHLPLGYSFPCNGQGNRRNNIFYPIDRLHYRLEPTERIFSKNEATACLKSKIKWIHVDGDSISRDILYDITELFGMGWNEKKKTLEDMEFDVGIHATFSGNTIEFSPQTNWVKSTSQIEKDQPQDCPDLWIYASGLWDQ